MSVERSLRLHDPAWWPVAISRGPAIAALALLFAAAAMVFWRRLAGALERPLEPGWLLAVGLLIALVAAAVRFGWFSTSQHDGPRIASWADWLVMAVASGSVVALWVGVCLPETAAVGLFLIAVILGVEESFSWAWFLQRHNPAAQVAEVSQTVSQSPQTQNSTTSAAVVPIPLDPPAAYDEQSETALDNPPSDVTQQLTRCQTVDGADQFSGWLRARFAAGQRTAGVHVAFCPPFAAMPELEAEQIDGPDARIKTSQLWPYGARLDIKLSAPAEEPTDVLLQFLAKTEKNRGSETGDVGRGM
ncbi:MAG: hypothetical protein ABFC77_13035 [Thermoguttaceae bacterium]